jgi:hypothetical protein
MSQKANLSAHLGQGGANRVKHRPKLTHKKQI